MKYFLTIAISLLLAQPALAARQVSGTVPLTTPLQPKPSGAAVNSKNNIQFQDQSHQGQFDAGGNLIQGSGQATGDASQTQNIPPNAAKPASGSRVWLWTLIIIVVGGVGWWGLKRKTA